MTALIALWAALFAGVGYEWCARHRWARHCDQALAVAAHLTPDDRYWMDQAGVEW